MASAGGRWMLRIRSASCTKWRAPGPRRAIASAGHYLQVLLERAGGDLAAAVSGYNHSRACVADVLARARAFTSGGELLAGAPAAEDASAAVECGGEPGAARGAANLRGVEHAASVRGAAGVGD